MVLFICREVDTAGYMICLRTSYSIEMALLVNYSIEMALLVNYSIEMALLVNYTQLKWPNKFIHKFYKPMLMEFHDTHDIWLLPKALTWKEDLQ